MSAKHGVLKTPEHALDVQGFHNAVLGARLEGGACVGREWKGRCLVVPCHASLVLARVRHEVNV